MVWNTSRMAFTRSSPLASISKFSPEALIEASVPLKSNRVRTSLTAMFRAFSTSWASTLLTMSNEFSAATALSFGSGPILAAIGPSLAIRSVGRESPRLAGDAPCTRVFHR